MSENRIMANGCRILPLLLLAGMAAQAQEMEQRSPILRAHGIYLAEAGASSCTAWQASGGVQERVCTVETTVRETLKGAPQANRASLEIVTRRPATGRIVDMEQIWGPEPPAAGTALVVFTTTGATADRNRFLGTQVSAVLDGSKDETVGDVRLASEVLRQGDPSGAAIRTLQTRSGWGPLFAQTAWELARPQALADGSGSRLSAISEAIASEGAGAPEGRSALITYLYQDYFQVQPDISENLARPYFRALTTILASQGHESLRTSAMAPLKRLVTREEFRQGRMGQMSARQRSQIVTNLRRTPQDQNATELAALLDQQ